MAIVAADLVARLSGGAANTDPDASLGGAVSGTALQSAVLHNLFDLVGSEESLAGDTEYRCFYFENNHATLTLLSAKVFVEAETPSPDTSVEIGLGSSGIDGTEQTVADENTAPTGVTFSTALGEENALVIGDLGPQQVIPIWVKRVVAQNAAAYNNDGATVVLKGDTAA